MSIVAEEATVTSTVPVLSPRLHRFGGFEESFLLDLEEDLNPGRVDEKVGLELPCELIKRVNKRRVAIGRTTLVRSLGESLGKPDTLWRLTCHTKPSAPGTRPCAPLGRSRHHMPPASGGESAMG
ncbi:hypothetical protein BHE74_00043062 [Ensete ventricosum]|nr:hypothetical protein BHE74_00043062 [Ensete ventricosum]